MKLDEREPSLPSGPSFAHSQIVYKPCQEEVKRKHMLLVDGQLGSALR